MIAELSLMEKIVLLEALQAAFQFIMLVIVVLAGIIYSER
jgi:hypothetical protein